MGIDKIHGLQLSQLVCWKFMSILVISTLFLSNKTHSYPQLGNRVYLLPPSDPEEGDDVSNLTVILPTNKGHTGMRDPLSDRAVNLNKVINQSISNSTEPIKKVESAYVTLRPLSITGKSKSPALFLDVEVQRVEHGDSFINPELLPKIYKDAQKFN